MLYSGSLVHKRVWVNYKVPMYGSKFPSMGLSSQVRVNNKQLQYIQVPEYGFRFPSTDFEENRYAKIANFLILKNDFYI